MTITIHEGYDRHCILINSKDERFTSVYGNDCRISTISLYRDLSNIASWVNNTLGEECLFEVD